MLFRKLIETLFQYQDGELNGFELTVLSFQLQNQTFAQVARSDAGRIQFLNNKNDFFNFIRLHIDVESEI
ncbi:hypothetical protein DSECCO2_613680 [anaerobic digester metagenome]